MHLNCAAPHILHYQHCTLYSRKEKKTLLLQKSVHILLKCDKLTSEKQINCNYTVPCIMERCVLFENSWQPVKTFPNYPIAISSPMCPGNCSWNWTTKVEVENLHLNQRNQNRDDNIGLQVKAFCFCVCAITRSPLVHLPAFVGDEAASLFFTSLLISNSVSQSVQHTLPC